MSVLSQQLDEVASMGQRTKRVYEDHFEFEWSPKHYNELLLNL